MSKGYRYGSAILRVLALVSVAACAEAPTEPDDLAPIGGSAANHEEIGPQDPPEYMPEEYQTGAYLGVTANAIWDHREQLGGPPGNVQYVAKGYSHITYIANNWENRVVLTVSGTHNGSNSSDDANTHFEPRAYSRTDSTEVVSPRPCGGIAQATATAKVWNSGPYGVELWHLVKWGEQRKTNTKSKSQPACAMQTGGSVGGESPGEDCVYLQMEISFDQGLTWQAWGEPFWYCDDEDGPGGGGPTNEAKRAFPGLGQATPVPPAGLASGVSEGIGLSLRSTAAKRSARVTILGTDTDPRSHAVVEADPTGLSEALVLIDTARATPEDLEVALSAAAHFIEKSPGVGKRIAIAGC